VAIELSFHVNAGRGGTKKAEPAARRCFQCRPISPSFESRRISRRKKLLLSGLLLEDSFEFPATQIPFWRLVRSPAFSDRQFDRSYRPWPPPRSGGIPLHADASGDQGLAARRNFGTRTAAVDRPGTSMLAPKGGCCFIDTGTQAEQVLARSRCNSLWFLHLDKDCTKYPLDRSAYPLSPSPARTNGALPVFKRPQGSCSQTVRGSFSTRPAPRQDLPTGSLTIWANAPNRLDRWRFDGEKPCCARRTFAHCQSRWDRSVGSTPPSDPEKALQNHRQPEVAYTLNRLLHCPGYAFFERDFREVVAPDRTPRRATAVPPPPRWPPLEVRQNRPSNTSENAEEKRSP